MATVVDPILTSFCNRIKAVRTLAAAKLPVQCDVARPASFATGIQLSRMCAAATWRGAGMYNIDLALPWCTHCAWHTAYYWPQAHNKLLGKLFYLTHSARDVRSHVRSEGSHWWGRIGYTFIDLPRRIMCIWLRRIATRRGADEQIVIEFVTISPLIFCMLIFLFCHPMFRGDWFILRAWRFTLGLFELRLHMYCFANMCAILCVMINLCMCIYYRALT